MVEFPSIISKDRIIGCQFHPEKSHIYGFKLLTTILEQVKHYAEDAKKSIEEIESITQPEYKINMIAEAVAIRED